MSLTFIRILGLNINKIKTKREFKSGPFIVLFLGINGAVAWRIILVAVIMFRQVLFCWPIVPAMICTTYCPPLYIWITEVLFSWMRLSNIKVDHCLFFRCSDVLEPTLYLRRGKVVLSVLETVLYTSISPNGFSDETKWIVENLYLSNIWEEFNAILMIIRWCFHPKKNEHIIKRWMLCLWF